MLSCCQSSYLSETWARNGQLLGRVPVSFVASALWVWPMGHMQRTESGPSPLSAQAAHWLSPRHQVGIGTLSWGSQTAVPLLPCPVITPGHQLSPTSWAGSSPLSSHIPLGSQARMTSHSCPESSRTCRSSRAGSRALGSLAVLLGF